MGDKFQKFFTYFLAVVFVICFILIGIGSCGGIRYLRDNRADSDVVYAAEENMQVSFYLNTSMFVLGQNETMHSDIMINYVPGQSPLTSLWFVTYYYYMDDSAVDTTVFVWNNDYSNGLRYTDVEYLYYDGQGLMYGECFVRLHTPDIIMPIYTTITYFNPASGNALGVRLSDGVNVENDLIIEFRDFRVSSYSYQESITIPLISSNVTMDGYNLGYDHGYDEGYDDGYDDGYDNGRDDGFDDGKNEGLYEGAANANDYSFLGLLTAVFDAPVKAFTGLLSFDLFGFDMAILYKSLFAVSIVILLIRLFI